ncbi:hypothetical protein ABIE33_007245, partial [Ensifer sp. 4252]
MRIPVMPDGYSNLKSDRYSNLMPDTITITIGMDAAIFFPQDQQCHAGLLQLNGKLRP